MDACARAEQLLAVGRWNEAVDVLADERSVGSGRAWDLTGRALLVGGDVSAAVDATARAVAADPESARAHDGHARALLADDRPRRAAEAARRAVELAPDDWAASVLAAHVLVEGGLAGTGAWYARRAVDLAPFEPDTHVAVAVCFWGSDARVSRRALLEALRLDPQHVEAQRLLGHLELGTDRLEAGAREIAHTAARSGRLASGDFARVGETWLGRMTLLVFLAAVVAVSVDASLPGTGDRSLWGLLVPVAVVAVVAVVTGWRLDRRLRGGLRSTLRVTVRHWFSRAQVGVVVVLLVATVVAAVVPDEGVRRLATTTALVTMVVAGVGTFVLSWVLAAWRSVRRSLRDR